jgi:hypothetical protein
LLEHLDDAIGQVQAHMQQCTCQAQCHDLDTAVPLRRGSLTVYQRSRHVLPDEG